MPNTLTLTTPIAIPNLRFVRTDRVLDVDEDAARMKVRLSVQGTGGRVYASPILEIANGQAQGIRATATPTGFGDVVEVFTTTTGVATAFDDVLAAYKANGRTGLLTALLALGLVPAGAVS